MLCKVIVCDLPGGDASTRRLGSLEDWDRQGASAGARRAAGRPRRPPRADISRDAPRPPGPGSVLFFKVKLDQLTSKLGSQVQVKSASNSKSTRHRLDCWLFSVESVRRCISVGGRCMRAAS